MLKQVFVSLFQKLGCICSIGSTRVVEAALPPPIASAGRSHPITTMTYSHGLCKDKEQDVGPQVCFFLLSEQDLSARTQELPLPLALSSKWRICAGTPLVPSHTWDGHSTTQHRPVPTTRKGPARAHLQPLHGTTTHGG